MHPSVHARSNPERPAIIVAETGEAISYGELDSASNRAAQLFRSHGLQHGHVVAFMLDMADANDAFRAELRTYAREKLSGVKIPRRIDSVAALPHHDTGKLYKRLLRDQYWAKADA